MRRVKNERNGLGTEYMFLLRHADEIVVLADGHVVEEGPYHELVDLKRGVSSLVHNSRSKGT